MINSYRFGQIVINQIHYEKDVIVFPGHVQENWRREKGHLLKQKDIESAFEKVQPEVLIVGTGHLGAMKIDPELIRFIEKEGISLYAEKTGKAVKLYNRLILLHDKVLGAFHLTC